MIVWWKLIAYYLLGYISIYILSHAPLDLIMLFRKKKVSYPGPPFEHVREAFFYLLASSIFLIYIYTTPFIALKTQTDVFTKIDLPTHLEFILRALGMLTMILGMLIAVFGRIGRGFYLCHPQPKLTTTWGHRIIRHPEYFMYITGFIGLPLLTQNFYLLFLLTGIYPYYRIASYEERQLLLLFGSLYRQYQDKVGMFFPKIRKY